jgi:hypothetical protein
VGGVPAFYPSPKTPEKKDNIFLYKALLTNIARYNTKIIVLLTKGGGA